MVVVVVVVVGTGLGCLPLGRRGLCCLLGDGLFLLGVGLEMLLALKLLLDLLS